MCAPARQRWLRPSGPAAARDTSRTVVRDSSHTVWHPLRLGSQRVAALAELKRGGVGRPAEADARQPSGSCCGSAADSKSVRSLSSALSVQVQVLPTRMRSWTHGNLLICSSPRNRVTEQRNAIALVPVHSRAGQQCERTGAAHRSGRQTPSASQQARTRSRFGACASCAPRSEYDRSGSHGNVQVSAVAYAIVLGDFPYLRRAQGDASTRRSKAPGLLAVAPDELSRADRRPHAHELRVARAAC